MTLIRRKPKHDVILLLQVFFASCGLFDLYSRTLSRRSRRSGDRDRTQKDEPMRRINKGRPLRAAACLSGTSLLRMVQVEGLFAAQPSLGRLDTAIRRDHHPSAAWCCYRYVGRSCRTYSMGRTEVQCSSGRLLLLLQGRGLYLTPAAGGGALKDSLRKVRGSCNRFRPHARMRQLEFDLVEARAQLHTQPRDWTPGYSGVGFGPTSWCVNCRR